MSTKSRFLVVVVLLSAIGAIQYSTLRPGHDWGGDFSMYVHHAKNLAEGIPYAETGYIYNVNYTTVGPPAYPPVCPLLLAPVYAMWGLDFEAMKLLMLASLMCFLLMVFWSFRGTLPFWHTVVIVAAVGLSRCFLGDANWIGSDLPFMAILYLTILVIQKAYDTEAPAPPRLGYLLTAAALMCVLFGTRTVGIVLFPSLLIHDVLRYRRITRSAVLLAGVGMAAVVVQRVLTDGAGGSYFDQYDVGLGLFVHNWIQYAAESASFWHNGYCKPLGAVLFLTVSALAAVGYAASLRRRVTFLEVFPVVYMTVVLLFPGFGGRRFLQPVFPLYLLFAARGLQTAWLARRATLRRVVLVSLLVGAAVSYVAAYTQCDFEIAEGIAKPESVAMFNHVIDKTDDDDVIVFIKPRVMALMTARKASVYHVPKGDDELWDYFERIGATHLVVVRSGALDGFDDPVRVQYLRDFADRHSAKLMPVFTNSDFCVYRIGSRETARAADRVCCP